MFPIGPGFYVVISFLLIIFWPFLLIDTFSPEIVVFIAILNTGLFTLTYYFCTNEFCSFYQSFRIIVAPTQSGCANITIIYAIPLIIGLFIYALLLSITGIFRGRLYTQTKWMNLVERFYNKI